MSRSRQLLTAYQWLAGASDTGTGLLLIAAPAWTLHLMGVHILPRPIAFASFIGVFVLSVGLTYLVVAARWPLTRGNAFLWRTQWMLTALIRSLVALFLFVEIIAGSMEPAWATVALTDSALAAIQWIGLARKWLADAQ